MPFRSSTCAARAGRAALSRLSGAVFLALAGAAVAAPAPQPLASHAKAGAAERTDLQLHMDAVHGVPTLLRADGDARGTALSKSLAAADPESLARAHLLAHRALYRLERTDVAGLRLREVQTLASGANLVRFTQQLGGLDVFREQATVLIGADGGLDGIGGFVIGVEGQAAKAAGGFRLDAAAALSRVLAQAGGKTATSLHVLRTEGEWQFLAPVTRAAGDRMVEPARTKRVFFRAEHGLVPAHYLEVALDEAAGSTWYAFVVSAKSGEVLYRHRLQEDAHFSYRVWASPVAPYTPYPGPQGRNGTPHPTAQPDGYQPTFVAPELVTLQSAPYSRNDPWLPDGATQTVGNNVDAYADLVETDGYNAGDLRPTLTAPGVFDRTYDTALVPYANSEQIAAATTQLFFTVNWLHDTFYDAGFDEAAGNAQASNYGRGGAEGDPILAEAQDYSGINNANMFTPADGAPPRMQMYVFSGAGASALTASGSMSGDFATGTAAFGPQQFDVSGPLQPAEPLRACSALANAAAVAGKVALVERGDCDFTIKVRAAQDAGAIGVVVFDNAAGPVAGMGGTDASVTIPALRTTQADGQALQSGVGTGAVDVRLRRIVGTDRDGTIDNAIVAHEWGHYISNRLIGNANGLTTQQARGMGEGWGDFHALLMMVQPEDINVPSNANWSGAYAAASYAVGGPSLPGALDNSAYHGIRRYPYSVDLTKNPLQFRHIDDSQAAPSTPPPAGGGPNSQVHNTGEVWGSMLLECYVSLLRAHPFEEARERMKLALVAGYKMTPVDPTFTEARDALLMALGANDPVDFIRCSNGFARRGAGAGAIAPDRYDPQNIGVVESYTTGGAVHATTAGIDDSLLSCDNDGVLDAGERGVLNVGLRNVGFQASTGGTTTVSAPQQVAFPDGASRSFPALARSADGSVSLSIASTTGPQAVIDLTVDSDGDGTAHSADFQLLGGYDIVASATERFEGNAAGWAADSEPGTPASMEWGLLALSPVQHVVHANDGASTGVSWLYTPALVVGSEPLQLDVSHRFSFESDAAADWDGGVIELSTDGGSSWTDLSSFGFGGYNGSIIAGQGNPAGGRAAFVAQSTGFPAFAALQIDLGTQFAGQTLQLRFGVATDAYVGAYGWDIDVVAASGIEGMPFQDRIEDQATCHALQIVGGDQQQVRTGNLFTSVLQVSATTAQGAPQAGYEVVFTLPASGASAVFAGSGTTWTVRTDAQGRATTPPLVANAFGGSYPVTARMGAQSVQFTLENILLPDGLFADGFESDGP